jgi:predicted transcriptional regulator of viral defense system
MIKGNYISKSKSKINQITKLNIGFTKILKEIIKIDITKIIPNLNQNKIMVIVINKTLKKNGYINEIRKGKKIIQIERNIIINNEFINCQVNFYFQ